MGLRINPGLAPVKRVSVRRAERPDFQGK